MAARRGTLLPLLRAPQGWPTVSPPATPQPKCWAPASCPVPSSPADRCAWLRAADWTAAEAAATLPTTSDFHRAPALSPPPSFWAGCRRDRRGLSPPQLLPLSSSASSPASAAAAAVGNNPCPAGAPLHPGLGPTQGTEKPRVVVLGSGWAACRFIKEIDTKAFDLVVVSPRNHMVFTPLLASTCVGTLEFRSVAEPVSVIQPALSLQPNSHFLLAQCRSISPKEHAIVCEAVGEALPSSGPPWRFSVSYDKLVVAVGAEASTFGIRGVHENAFFLREVQDSQQIRRRLLLNLMRSEMPGIPESERRRLLSCVVVGGGPTGVEFSGELGDFIRKDVRRKYAHVKDFVNVTLIEAKEILSSFDVGLREYAVRQLTKSGVSLVKGQVREVQPGLVVLDTGETVPFGLLVWSTGVGPSHLVTSLPLPKSPGGRIAVDEHLRVVGHRDMFALGDCAGYGQDTGKAVLPALAQVAERQGKYLAHLFNRMHRRKGWGRAEAEAEAEGARRGPVEEEDVGPPFVYRHLGSMATIGRYRALVDLREKKSGPGISMAGFLSFLIWRSAYLTRVISWRNRLYVAVNWATTMVFGRDTSRI